MSLVSGLLSPFDSLFSLLSYFFSRVSRLPSLFSLLSSLFSRIPSLFSLFYRLPSVVSLLSSLLSYQVPRDQPILPTGRNARKLARPPVCAYLRWCMLRASIPDAAWGGASQMAALDIFVLNISVNSGTVHYKINLNVQKTNRYVTHGACFGGASGNDDVRASMHGKE